MANDADNVRVGTNGSIYIAPKGTTAPTDLDTAWAAGWVDLGYLSDDGVELPISTDTEDINAWQSLSPVRKILTGFNLEISFTCIELKTSTVTLFFPSATMTDVSPGVHKLSIPAAPSSDERAIGLEWIDGTIKNRLIIPRGEVTNRDSITVARSGAVQLPMTVSAYADTAPEIAIWLSNDPAFAAV